MPGSFRHMTKSVSASNDVVDPLRRASEGGGPLTMARHGKECERGCIQNQFSFLSTTMNECDIEEERGEASVLV